MAHERRQADSVDAATLEKTRRGSAAVSRIEREDRLRRLSVSTSSRFGDASKNLGTLDDSVAVGVEAVTPDLAEFSETESSIIVDAIDEDARSGSQSVAETATSDAETDVVPTTAIGGTRAIFSESEESDEDESAVHGYPASSDYDDESVAVAGATGRSAGDVLETVNEDELSDAAIIRRSVANADRRPTISDKLMPSLSKASLYNREGAASISSVGPVGEHKSGAADDDVLNEGPPPCRLNDNVTVRAVLVSFYTTYAPEKLRDVDVVLEHFSGREEALLYTLDCKYSIVIQPDGTVLPATSLNRAVSANSLYHQQRRGTYASTYSESTDVSEFTTDSVKGFEPAVGDDGVGGRMAYGVPSSVNETAWG